jgi:hypothetical protein
VPIVERVLGRDADDTEGRAEATSFVGRVQRGMRRPVSDLAGLIGRHRLFSVALGLSVVPRVIVMLGFQPAILFKLDTYDYLWDAAHLAPNPVNPTGYSLFLWVLQPSHSLALVAGLQHLLGLCAAVLVYATLRRCGVRQWIATLATLPLLFSPAEFLLEHLIMADLLSMVLMIAGFAVLLLRPSPSLLRSATAGLLVGASAVVRPTTLPLIAIAALYLLIRRGGWRQVCAVLVAGVVPVVAYMSWFSVVNGSFTFTNSNGLFLWSRTMSFANCAVIKPPADLRALCLEQQPLTRAHPGQTDRLQPKRYLWDHRAWQWQPPPTGLVPDASAFTIANNSRAMRFAVRAIEAQPLAYAHTVSRDVLKPFIKPIGFLFPPLSNGARGIVGQNKKYAVAAVTAYLGSTQGLERYLGAHLGQRVVEPYGHLIRGYQRVIFLPGPVFALILIVGLAGLLFPSRRSAAGAMLWLAAVIVFLLPIAVHEYNYRYALPAIPLACMAAALVFRGRPVAAATDGGPVRVAASTDSAAVTGGTGLAEADVGGTAQGPAGTQRGPTAQQRRAGSSR